MVSLQSLGGTRHTPTRNNTKSCLLLLLLLDAKRPFLRLLPCRLVKASMRGAYEVRGTSSVAGYCTRSVVQSLLLNHHPHYCRRAISFQARGGGCSQQYPGGVPSRIKAETNLPHHYSAGSCPCPRAGLDVPPPKKAEERSRRRSWCKGALRSQRNSVNTALVVVPW